MAAALLAATSVDIDDTVVGDMSQSRGRRSVGVVSAHAPPPRTIHENDRPRGVGEYRPSAISADVVATRRLAVEGVEKQRGAGAGEWDCRALLLWF